MDDASPALALHVAGRARRPPDARGAVDGGAGAGQGDHRPGALSLRLRHRCAGAQGQRARTDADVAHLSGGHGGGLQHRPHSAERLQQPARRAVLRRQPIRRPPPRQSHLRPHASAVAALSPAAAHRRPDPRHRSRRQGHRIDRPLHHPQRHADGAGIRPVGRRHRGELRPELSPGDRHHHLALRLVLDQLFRQAHRHPPPHERQRHRRQHQVGRQPAELRDGQVFRQREDGGGALRRRHGALRGGRQRDLVLAVLAQHGAGGDLHRRRRRVHGDVGPRGGGRHPDARRLRAAQHAADAARHPAQFHRLHVPRDPPGRHRPRADVRPPGRAGGDRRRAECRPARRQGRFGALRGRALRLRPRPPDPEGHHLRDPGRQDGGRRRAVGRRQVDAVAPPVPLLRRHLRPRHHRRPGHPRRDAGELAVGHRHGAAGHRAVQRQHLLQHPLRPAGRHRRRGARGGAAGAHRPFRREPAERLRHAGRRARPQAVGRREAARRHRPHHPEVAADPDPRRGDLGARHQHRARDPGRARPRRRGPHHHGDRPPAVDGGQRRRDHRAGEGAHRRARRARRADREGRPLRHHVGPPARGRRGGGAARPGQGGGRPRRSRTGQQERAGRPAGLTVACLKVQDDGVGSFGRSERFVRHNALVCVERLRDRKSITMDAQARAKCSNNRSRHRNPLPASTGRAPSPMRCPVSPPAPPSPVSPTGSGRCPASTISAR
ncbi:hypothetical protein KL86PLE_10283 [uncultured Pleomorphomonas sp.]|uniref:Uncharacterized protein n=1 Tax=uncultured Pleomorphomonas sp. TaxID=442121 RepID=A0A212KZY1_9HYPH|nr:hypothetical protein KL86PLE_10283 [uncultured Pleomorphomonas sp.]